MGKGMKLGQGGRFAALTSKLASEPGVTDPGALAASIGRAKYGKAKMARMASHLPKGVPLSPSGDLGVARQKEADTQRGFKSEGGIVRVAGMFSGINAEGTGGKPKAAGSKK